MWVRWPCRLCVRHEPDPSPVYPLAPCAQLLSIAVSAKHSCQTLAAAARWLALALKQGHYDLEVNMKTAVKTLAILTAVSAAMVLGTAPAGASKWDDGTDPVASGCAADAVTVAAYPMTSDEGEYITDLQVRYSPKCQTNWVRVNNPYSSGETTVMASIRKTPEQGKFYNYSEETGDSWTIQLWAPGSTCILVLAAIIDNDTHQRLAGSEYTEVKVC
jgi:hypothetical protein